MAQFRFGSERRRGSFGGGEVEWTWWAWKRQERMMCLGWPPRACAAKWEWVNGPRYLWPGSVTTESQHRARSSPRLLAALLNGRQPAVGTGRWRVPFLSAVYHQHQHTSTSFLWWLWVYIVASVQLHCENNSTRTRAEAVHSLILNATRTQGLMACLETLFLAIW